MTKLLVNDTFDPFGAMRVYKYVAIMQPIMPDAGSDDGRILRILVLLADAEKVSNKFRLTAKPGEELSIFTSAQMDTEIAALDNRMRQQAARRQKGASLVKLTGWALYDKDLYTNLIENITGLLDNLERTFPAQEAQGSLTVTEIEELSEEIRDKQASMLKILHDLSAGVDRMMHNEMRDLVAAKKISIGSMEVGENARVRDGNFYSSAWKGETSVPKATGEISMESIRVGESARLMNGDTCRDKDDFWD
ncbi:hypothetical protein BJX63DRAFT_432881 [Aspergillus granulosus]|uniref:Prion-inhibition and propagation HeLo domain-containing protein n=1 Tax=Aspergillus granulosus TaxID=176169 RepID=A0ABR4H9Z4_9EURO